MGDFGIFIPMMYRNLAKFQKSFRSPPIALGHGEAFLERKNALEGILVG
jgi:hypothetical protein